MALAGTSQSTTASRNGCRRRNFGFPGNEGTWVVVAAAAWQQRQQVLLIAYYSASIHTEVNALLSEGLRMTDLCPVLNSVGGKDAGRRGNLTFYCIRGAAADRFSSRVGGMKGNRKKEERREG